MAEMEAMGPETMKMPFDGKRMIYGGFETLVELQKIERDTFIPNAFRHTQRIPDEIWIVSIV